MTYPSEVKAQALALRELGYSSYKAHAFLAEEFGDDAPALSTIRSWNQELAISAPEQDERILANAREIASIAQRLIIDTLETMEPDAKSLVNLNIVAGTAIDKILNARRAPAQNLNIDKAIIVIERQQ